MSANEQLIKATLAKLEGDDRKRAQAVIDSAAQLQETIELIVPKNDLGGAAMQNLDTVVVQALRAIERG